MKIGIVQMPVTADINANLSRARRDVASCAVGGARLVALPEMFVCPYTNDSFAANAQPAGGPIWSAMADIAARFKVWLVGGSIPEADGGKIYNTSFVFDPSGKQVARFRKMHLFDIDVQGGQRFKESDTFSPGDQIVTFDAEGVRIGLCICFDIRFPELARLMALDGAQVIIVPAAFNMTTGPAHWELAFRQRAVDNQLLTVGIAPARDINGPYVSYGNSIICSPWGSPVYRAGAAPDTHVERLDITLVDKIRQQLPLLGARRTDIYDITRA